ncbi:MAG: uracil-DNA glycosylase [Campylobacterota bacterium]|nr:uracil-DNA glycosylase [Campylobacterota bacterium]
MSRQLQNLLLLNELYRLESLGVEFIDPITIQHSVDDELPNDLNMLKELVSSCHLCNLSKSRNQSMFGYGSLSANIMFVDSVVSSASDEANSYYAGKSAEILQNMIEKVLGLSVEDVYFTTALKCKCDVENANDYFDSCKAYLFKQIEIVKPKLVVALGEDAYRLISADKSPLHTLRGRSIKFEKYDLIATHHPLYLLRNPSKKRESMYDLQNIKSYI